MSTVQIVAIVVASLAVLLLVIALVVTRRRSEDTDEDIRAPGSFLDEAPQDSFAGLGRAEVPVEDVTLDPALEREAAARRAAAAEQARHERRPPPAGLGLDWGPDLSVRGVGVSPEPGPAAAGEDEAEVTGELRQDDHPTLAIPAGGVSAGEAATGEAGLDQAGTESGRTADAEAAGPSEEPDAGGRMVPLSDVIVTTSSKMVDLDDPEVRRMLTELVTFEIDQAAEYRRQGQTIDAILQLTEAEKVSRALGMTESALRIHEMMDEIRGDE